MAIIVVHGTPLSDLIIAYTKTKEFTSPDSELKDSLDKGHIYCLETYDSEEIAGFLHFFLTVSPWGPSKKAPVEEKEKENEKVNEKVKENEKEKEKVKEEVK